MSKSKGPDPRNYYKLLGVAPTATEKEIVKGFRKMALKYHPDRNPGKEAESMFKKCQEAKSVLTDKVKRKNYDEFGDPEGPKNSGPSSIFDLFNGGGPRGARGPKKTESIRFELGVSLEQLYNGAEKKIAVRKQVLCGLCEGSGSKVKGVDTTCKTCEGRGWKMEVQRSGFQIMQYQTGCTDCKGTGSQVAPADRCTKCKGQKTMEEKKVLVVYIDKGMKDGDKITFTEEADQAPGCTPGDVIVVLRQHKHKYKRSGRNLVIERQIPLYQALCGVRFKFNHLDDRTLIVESGEGKTVKPNDVLVVEGEGMPCRGRPFEKGDLIFKFSVTFPDTVTEEQKAQFSKLLKAAEPVTAGAEDETFTLKEFDEERYVKMEKEDKAFAREAYKEDESRGPGGQPGCASQ